MPPAWRSLCVFACVCGLSKHALGEELRPRVPSAVIPASSVPASREGGALTSLAPAQQGRASTRDAPAASAGSVQDKSSALQVALAVNLPLGWPESIGGSLYLAVSRHHVLRANLARYNGWVGFDTVVSGPITDYGLAWSWYSVRRWQGPIFEAGVLARHRDIQEYAEFSPMIDTDTNVFAVRGLIGWSWLLGNHVFIATAVGISSGYERGDETVTEDLPGSMPVTSRVKRGRSELETYLRFGWVFEN